MKDKRIKRNRTFDGGKVKTKTETPRTKTREEKNTVALEKNIESEGLSLKPSYDVIVVGGGYSGLVATAKLLQNGVRNVLIVEGLPRVGKKILATGNGRANVTNAKLSGGYHGDAEFAKYALNRFDNADVENFFASLGTPLVYEGDRAYPISLQASSVLDALRFAVKGADVLTGERVKALYKENGGFVAVTEQRKIKGKEVILAFGGSAGQGFGTDGSSYGLALGFGHSLTRLSPSLSQLKTEQTFLKGLKGVKVDARVSLCDGANSFREVKTAKGDILFTDYGVSGNTVFFLSAYLDECKEPYLAVEFLPDVDDGVIEKTIKTRSRLYREQNASALLQGLLHNKLAEKIMRDVSEKKTVAELTDEELIKAKTAIKRYIGRVTGSVGFELAQVTRGGILCDEVDEKSMRSKKVDGLYIIGEALNVDGDCGGYNLQWAYSSACAAAEAIYGKKLNG